MCAANPALTRSTFSCDIPSIIPLQGADGVETVAPYSGINPSATIGAVAAAAARLTRWRGRRGGGEVLDQRRGLVGLLDVR